MEALVSLLANAGYDIDRQTVDLLLGFNELVESNPGILDALMSMRPYADALTVEGLLNIDLPVATRIA